MKTLMTSISILCIFSLSTNAQFTKGKWFGGTTTDLSSGLYSHAYSGGGNQAGLSFISNWTKSGGQTSDKEKATGWNFTPKVGYFFIDGLVGGLDINIRGESWKEENGDKDKMSVLTIGPFVRYYAVQYALMSGKIVPFAEGKFLFGSAKDSYTSGSSTYTDKYGLSEFAIGPGLTFLLSDFVSVDMMVVYKRVTWKDKDTTDEYIDYTSAFGFTFGLSFFFACGGQ